jgi:hypothetical protein
VAVVIICFIWGGFTYVQNLSTLKICDEYFAPSPFLQLFACEQYFAQNTVGVLLIYLDTKFHMSRSNKSVIAIKRKLKIRSYSNHSVVNVLKKIITEHKTHTFRWPIAYINSGLYINWCRGAFIQQIRMVFLFFVTAVRKKLRAWFGLHTKILTVADLAQNLKWGVTHRQHSDLVSPSFSSYTKEM